MSLTLAAAGVAAGAASGAAGGFMQKGKKISVPKYTPHEKKLTTTSQALAPYYMNMLTGRSTPFLDRLMAQQRSLGAQQGRQNIQGFLRQAGMRGGGDFGPAAYGQLGRIYGQISPSVMQAVNQARLQGNQQAVQGMQRWSLIKPGTKSQPKAPSMGSHIAAGALGGLGQSLGAMGKGGAASAATQAAVPNQSLPPAQQGPVRQSVQVNEGLQAAQNATKSPYFPQGMNPYPGRF